MNGMLGRKLGMTRLFDADGRATPVTVIEAGPCPVVQVKAPPGEGGVWAVQLGLGVRRPGRATRAAAGHARKAGLEATPAVLRDVRVAAGTEAAPQTGQSVTVSIFAPGDFVKVTGTTKGRGFQGVVKRHGFGGGPATHGNTRHRKPGSVGPGTDPSRVIKGKRMPGHMGAAQHTEVSLRVVRVDADRNLLFVRGAVPGPVRGIVTVRKQGGRGRYA
jgi:large subunit ribosomal protein L3